MVILKKEHVRKIIEHAKSEYPKEACGILSGRDETVRTVYRAKNIASSSTEFEIDPEEQYKIFKDIEEKNLEILGIYHSHPFWPAYPSAVDLERAFCNDTLHFIVSLQHPSPLLRVFRICNKKIEEEEIKIR
jgi:proteasome lid subunit RPN8/RPN11